MITAPLRYLPDGSIAPPEPPKGCTWSAADVPAGVYRYYQPGDPLPVIPASPPPADWVEFRRAMLKEANYKAIAKQYWQASRVENAILVEVPDLPTIIELWNQLIDVLVLPPSTAAIAAWNALAVQHRIQLTFKTNGRL